MKFIVSTTRCSSLKLSNYLSFRNRVYFRKKRLVNPLQNSTISLDGFFTSDRTNLAVASFCIHYVTKVTPGCFLVIIKCHQTRKFFLCQKPANILWTVQQLHYLWVTSSLIISNALPLTKHHINPCDFLHTALKVVTKYRFDGLKDPTTYSSPRLRLSLD